ncbi:MAG: FmdB family zinc ribbon protein [Rubrobacter sp.]
MPIYEYKCENDHVFDVMQKMSEDPLTTCIECGAPVRKVLQPVGISFKGSGFYSTDYNSKKGPKEPAATSSNGDSKPDTKEKKSADKSSDKSAASSSSSKTKD